MKYCLKLILYAGWGGLWMVMLSGEFTPAWAMESLLKETADLAQVEVNKPSRPGSPVLTIKMPDIAENGAVVPVTIEPVPGWGLKKANLLVYDCREKHVLAWYQLPSGSNWPISFRVKIPRTGDVAAVAMADNGSWAYGRKNVKVTIGGAGDGGSPRPQSGGEFEAQTLPWPSVLPAHRLRLRLENGEQLAVEKVHMDVRLDGFVARVLMHIQVKYPALRWRQAQFQLRLPEGASPYFIAFGQRPVKQANRAGRHPWPKNLGFPSEQTHRSLVKVMPYLKQARMVERKKARFAYTRTVERRVDPALVEWQGKGVFSVKVFPMMQGDNHIVFAYDVKIPQVNRERLLEVAFPANTQSVRINVPKRLGKNGVKFSRAANRSGIRGKRRYFDFDAPLKGRLRVSYRRQPVMLTSARDNGFSVAEIEPPVPVVQDTFLQEALFLVDRSASISKQQMGETQHAVERILAENDNRIKTFRLYAYNQDLLDWRGKAMDNSNGNRRSVKHWLGSLVSKGASDQGRMTDLIRRIAAKTASKTAAKMAGSGEALLPVFVFSDGNNTWGGPMGRRKTATPDRARVFLYHQAGTKVSQWLRQWVQATGGVITQMDKNTLPWSAYHRMQPWQIDYVYVNGTYSSALLGGSYLRAGDTRLLISRDKIKKGGQINMRLHWKDKHTVVDMQIPPLLESDAAYRYFGSHFYQSFEPRLSAKEKIAVSRYFRLTNNHVSLLMLETQSDYDRFAIKNHDDLSVVDAIPWRYWYRDPAVYQTPLFITKINSANSRLSLEARYLISKMRHKLHRFNRQGASRYPARLAAVADDMERRGVQALTAAVMALEQAGLYSEAMGLLLDYVGNTKLNHYRLYRVLARLSEKLGEDELAVQAYELAIGEMRDPVDIMGNKVYREYSRLLKSAIKRRRIGARGILRERLKTISTKAGQAVEFGQVVHAAMSVCR